jgi:hypothetical protein
LRASLQARSGTRALLPGQQGRGRSGQAARGVSRTTGDIEAFSDKLRGSSTAAKSAAVGHWFTNDPRVADSYGQHAATDAPFVVQIREAKNGHFFYDLGRNNEGDAGLKLKRGDSGVNLHHSPKRPASDDKIVPPDSDSKFSGRAPMRPTAPPVSQA